MTALALYLALGLAIGAVQLARPARTSCEVGALVLLGGLFSVGLFILLSSGDPS